MKFILPLSLLFIPLLAFSQGMILNELSNGDSGSKEFMEFVVIGSAANPTGAVDLSGWIIDDNNGDFENQGSGVGIATGHIRIAAGCMTAVAPGSIILIYNQDDLNAGIANGASDPGDANGDCTYIFTTNDPCLERCTSSPIVPSTSNGDYTACDTYSPSTTWTNIGMSNAQDVSQVRMPDGSFFHGFSYGLNAPFPNFPASLGGGSAFNVAGSGSGGTFYFNCGDFTDVANFQRGPALTEQTPGAPNNDGNRHFINALRDGTYDYTNFAAAGNCGSAATLSPCPVILPLELSYFDAEKDHQTAVLSWGTELTTVVKYEIQRSADALHFYTIGELTAELAGTDNLFVDESPKAVNYYRLKIYEADGTYKYSRVKNLNYKTFEQGFVVYPNPVGVEATVRLALPLAQKGELIVIDMLGRVVRRQLVPVGQEELFLDCRQLAAGTYVLRLETEGYSMTRKFVK
jgi:hypothetical protein